MNYIEFPTESLRREAVTMLELCGAPTFEVHGNRICSEEIAVIIDLLQNEDIWTFDAPHLENDEPDPFHGRDGEADADALASAGMGDDEAYGYFGGNDDE